MPLKIKTEIEGKQHEVEVPDDEVIAAGYQPAANFEKELTRRGVSIATKQGYVKPDELTPEQIVELAKKKEVKLPAEETTTPADVATAINEAVNRKRQEWETQVLAPITKKVEELGAAEEELLQKQLHGQIIAAAAAVGVEKTLLKAPTKTSLPPIVSMLESAFAYDTETKQFLVLSDDGEGFVFSERPTQDHPYQDPEEFLERWAANKDNQKFIIPEAQRGPSLAGTTGAGRPANAPVHLTRAESRNMQLLEAAKKEAVRRGLDPFNGGIVVGD